MSGVKKSENTAWSFKVDTVNAYAYWEKHLPQKNVIKLLK